jgi:DNA-binding MarR family transcriptional regulator
VRVDDQVIADPDGVVPEPLGFLGHAHRGLETEMLRKLDTEFRPADRDPPKLAVDLYSLPAGVAEEMTPETAVAADELRAAVGQLIRRLRAEQRFPLSHGVTLGRLEREGPHTTSDLAAAGHVRPQSMAQTISDLEAAGSVARRPDPHDRRKILIEITEAGRATLASERLRQGDWLALAIGQLTPEERSLIVEAAPLLARLARM